MGFRDRREAGQRLAERLATWADRPDVIVIGLPRGGVVVAFEVARALRAPLEVLIVRKLGVPGSEELAMGAIACAALERSADDCVCLVVPTPFLGVGAWYADFRQTTDDEVRALLAHPMVDDRRQPAGAAPGGDHDQ